LYRYPAAPVYQLSSAAAIILHACARHPSPYSQSQEDQITASEVLAESLIDWGVDTIFGLPGDGINGFVDAL
jgi:hypothetical protein